MSSQGFHPIPPDIIEAWAKGEYYVGDIPSISYTRLGTALFLRGWYTYQHADQDRERFGGVVKIDIKGSFLLMGGIRLHDSKSRTTVFWRSEASHFLSNNEIIWFYSIFNCDLTGKEADVRAKYVSDSWLQQTEYSSPENHFSMSVEEWNNLLDKLRTDFDSDIERIQKSCPAEQIDEGMLRYDLVPDEQNRHQTTYYQFYSAPGKERALLRGAAYFVKTSKR
jgi:hypothetical protein